VRLRDLGRFEGVVWDFAPTGALTASSMTWPPP
jgi:hypothetical protein